MKNILLICSTVLLALILTNCSSDSTNPSSGTNPNDTTLSITTLSPSSKGTNIDINTDFKITFNKNITQGNGKLTIYNYSNDNAIQEYEVSKYGNFSINNLTVTHNNSLAYSTKYYVLLDSGSIIYSESKVYSGISDKDTWTFTTGAKPPNQLTATISGADNVNFTAVPASITMHQSGGGSSNTININGTADANGNHYELTISFDYNGSVAYDLSKQSVPCSVTVKNPFNDVFSTNVTGQLQLNNSNIDSEISGSFNFNAYTQDKTKSLSITGGVFAFYK